MSARHRIFERFRGERRLRHRHDDAAECGQVVSRWTYRAAGASRLRHRSMRGAKIHGGRGSRATWAETCTHDVDR